VCVRRLIALEAENYTSKITSTIFRPLSPNVDTPECCRLIVTRLGDVVTACQIFTMLSTWAGAGAALDGRRLFDLADARKIVDAKWKHDDKRFARALANAPHLEAVIPQAEGVDSAWRAVGTTLAAPSWDPSLRVPLTALDAAPPAEQETLRFGEGDERSPLMPSLFMPGFPKAATTFLYNCMLANFGPMHVGCGRLRQRDTLTLPHPFPYTYPPTPTPTPLPYPYPTPTPTPLTPNPTPTPTPTPNPSPNPNPS
jgi:hypothetical protein